MVAVAEKLKEKPELMRALMNVAPLTGPDAFCNKPQRKKTCKRFYMNCSVLCVCCLCDCKYKMPPH